MRLIDADELLEKVHNYYPSIDYLCISVPCVELRDIKSAPTKKAKPARHGEWVTNKSPYDKRDNFYHCSLCGRTINVICGETLEKYPYCHCGAKMDGGNDDL